MLALALLVPGLADASDASFRTALDTWSHRIGADASGIGLSAVHGHPRRLAARGLHFRADALRARHALSRVRLSTSRGRRAKRLALGAFAEYAVVGRFWALAGRARVARHSARATTDARVAATHARRATTLLVRAGALLH